MKEEVAVGRGLPLVVSGGKVQVGGNNRMRERDHGFWIAGGCERGEGENIRRETERGYGRERERFG